jgi:hypothetical protein
MSNNKLLSGACMEFAFRKGFTGQCFCLHSSTAAAVVEFCVLIIVSEPNLSTHRIDFAKKRKAKNPIYVNFS